MNETEIKSLLKDFKESKLTEEDFIKKIETNRLMVEDIGFAKIDHLRESRQGFPEVIYAEGKTKDEVARIFKALSDKSSGSVLATRANSEKYEATKELTPDAKYDERARIIYLERNL